MNAVSNNNCLIFEDEQTNFAILDRLVRSFNLEPVKINSFEVASTLNYLELRYISLVIIDIDCMAGTKPGEITTRIKYINPECLVMWIGAHEPACKLKMARQPDIILKKPFGMMLFQQELTHYMFAQSVGTPQIEELVT